MKCYSLECFQAIGGIQERLGWDTIDEIYARMRGYRTRVFPDLIAHHHRPWGSADGTLRGRARHGRCAYIVHFPLPWVDPAGLQDRARAAAGTVGCGVPLRLPALGGRAACRASRTPRSASFVRRRASRARVRDAFTSRISRRAPKLVPLADGER